MLKNALHKQLLSVVQRLAVISRVMKHGSSVYFLLCQFYGPLGVRMFLSHRSVFNVPSGCLRWPETNDGVQGQIPELRGSARPRPSERAVWILSTHRPEVLQVHGSSPAACHSNDSLDSSCWPLQPWPFIRAARERERERQNEWVWQRKNGAAYGSLSRSHDRFLLQLHSSSSLLSVRGCSPPLGLPTEPVKFTHTPLSERHVCPWAFCRTPEPFIHTHTHTCWSAAKIRHVLISLVHRTQRDTD